MTTCRISLVVAACAALAACGDTVTPVPPPPPTQHLYVGDDAATGFLRSYALPLTANSVPVAAVAMNKPFTIGVNSTTLAVTTLSADMSFFTLPLTSTSVPYATFAAGSDGTPLFVGLGYLDQGGSRSINVYLPPFSNASVPGSSIATPGLDPDELAIDPAGNIYESSGANTIAVVSAGAVVATLTAAAGTEFRGMAASATQLFACGFTGQSYNMYVYALPLTASAVPVATINFGTDPAEGCALDASGNLYVGTIGGRIFVYAPPITSSSAPKVILSTTAIIFGLAVGP